MTQKIHLLQFVALDPQPKNGVVQYTEAHDILTDCESRWAWPEGWSALETTTQTLFGNVCWVRMADHLLNE